MNKAEKKQWQVPELIVLVRSKPEEVVLARCSLTTSQTRRGCTNAQCATRRTARTATTS